MMDLDFEEVRETAVRLGPIASFCTVTPKGAPHVVPLMVLWDGDQLVIGTRAGTAKARNLRASQKAAIQYLSHAEFPDALLLRGNAELLDDDDSKKHYWDSGIFGPILGMLYDDHTDPQLCFIRFTPQRASLTLDGARAGPGRTWRRDGAGL